MICKHKSTNSSKYCYVSLTIQFNISHLFTHSYMIKQFYFNQFILAWDICLHSVLFDLLHSVLFDLLMGPYQVLPLRARVDLVAMAMKEYSAFIKASALLEPQHHCLMPYQDTHCGEGSFSSAEMQPVYSTAPSVPLVSDDIMMDTNIRFRAIFKPYHRLALTAAAGVTRIR